MPGGDSFLRWRETRTNDDETTNNDDEKERAAIETKMFGDCFLQQLDDDDDGGVSAFPWLNLVGQANEVIRTSRCEKVSSFEANS